MPGEVKRAARLAPRVAEHIAMLLGSKVKDPRLAAVTVTRVTMPDDLRSAKVLFRLLGSDEPAAREEALTGLRRAAGVLRKEIGHGLGLRYAPELTFAFDDEPDAVQRIEELLEEVKAEERGRKGR